MIPPQGSKDVKMKGHGGHRNLTKVAFHTLIFYNFCENKNRKNKINLIVI